MPEKKTVEDLKKEIDKMSQLELCRRWRFSIPGSPYFQGEVGAYFAAALKSVGGFTPEISKKLGW